MTILRICSIFLFIGTVILTLSPVSGEPAAPEAIVFAPSAGFDSVSLSTIEKTADEYGITLQLVTSDGLLQNGSYTGNLTPIAIKDIHDSYLNQSTVPLILLGGSGYKDLEDDQDLLTLLHDWNQSGHLIGAIGQAPAILSKAGILENVSATVKPENNLVKTTKDGGARYVNSPGVLTDSIITARDSNEAENFSKTIFNHIIVQKVSSRAGILYLGDTVSNTSVYCIPGELSSTRVNALQNGTIIPDWDNSPFFLQTLSKPGTFETGVDDWILMYEPDGGLCVLSDPFSGISIPYGTIQMVQSEKLGSKRDFSTVSGKVRALFPTISFREILRSSPELDQSNNSMKEWTEDINLTNKTISDSLGDLFDDIRISMPIWDGLSARVCVQGRGIHNGVIDVRTVRDDSSTSLLFSRKPVESDMCTEILVTEKYDPNIPAFVVLIGEGDMVIADLQIIIPPSP